jgi:hypothetical protein
MEHKTQEIWKLIPDTNERYSISDYGVVRSNWADIPQRNLTHRKRIEKTSLLKAWLHTTGYMRVALGRGKQKYIHRLVAQAFLPNPDNLPQVDHMDGNRTNNHVSNLRWVTVQQNAIMGGDRHNWDAQRIASAKRRIYDVKKKEFQALLDQGCSLRYVAKLFGTSHSVISRIVKG